MLKLMKHEFRATGRTMLPMYLLTLAMALGARVSMRNFLETDNTWLNMIGVLLMMVFVCLMAAICIMSVVIMVQRFHQNVLGDEGYVTMTLPVSVHAQVWSKLLVSTVWFALTIVVVVLGMVVLIYEQDLIPQIFRGFAMLLEELDLKWTVHGVLWVLELLILAVLACCAVCLRFYSAMAIGHSFANYKVPISVVVFFALQALMQSLVTALGVGFNAVGGLEALGGAVEQLMSNAPVAGTHMVLWGSIGLTVVSGAVYYVLTVYFLQKRLNLE